jgi:hypothetical protein
MPISFFSKSEAKRAFTFSIIASPARVLAASLRPPAIFTLMYTNA